MGKSPTFADLTPKAADTDIPKRSWRKGDGGYNAKFEWEGATVYVAFPKDWDDVVEKQKKMVADSKAMKVVMDDVTERANQGKDVPQEEIDASEVKAKEAYARQQSFIGEIISQCVIGWKDAPFPFSPEERDNLQVEIKAEWLGKIMEVSQLSAAEAAFLGKS